MAVHFRVLFYYQPLGVQYYNIITILYTSISDYLRNNVQIYILIINNTCMYCTYVNKLVVL